MTHTPDTIHASLEKLALTRFGERARGITPEQDFFEILGIDSFQAMELLTEVEDTFGIEVPDYELQGITTFKALGEVIRRRL